MNTSSGPLDYQGPGWYRDGKKVAEPHAVRPCNATLVKLDEDEVHRMIAEGCPHCHEIETTSPSGLDGAKHWMYNKAVALKQWVTHLFGKR